MDFINEAVGLISSQELSTALVYFAHSAWGSSCVVVAMLLCSFIGVASGSPMPALEGIGSTAVFSILAPAMPTPALMNVSFALAVAWWLWVVVGPRHSVVEAWNRRYETPHEKAPEGAKN